MAHYQINVDSNILRQLCIGDWKDGGVAKLLESVWNRRLFKTLRISGYKEVRPYICVSESFQPALYAYFLKYSFF